MIHPSTETITGKSVELVRGAELSREVRVLNKHVGSLLGPEFDIAVSDSDKRYRVGALTLRLLKTGTPLEDLDLLEVDPDAREDD